jgi:hypothetical protein
MVLNSCQVHSFITITLSCSLTFWHSNRLEPSAHPSSSVPLRLCGEYLPSVSLALEACIFSPLCPLCLGGELFPAPSDSGLPLVAGMTPGGRRGPRLRKIAGPLRPWCLCALVVSVFLFSTNGERRTRMDSRVRLSSAVLRLTSNS